MKPNKAIIRILKSFLNSQVITDSLDIREWKDFNRLAEVNSISGIIGYMFQQSDSNDIPKEIFEKYQNEYFSTIAITTMRDEDMKTMISLLNQNQIDHLLFKGYVVKELYTIPDLRTYGDVDFAIRQESRDACNDLLRRSGFELIDDWEPVYSYKKNMGYYEIHTELLDSNLNDKYDYKAYFKDFWDFSIRKDKHTYVLDIEYHLLYLLLHIAKHVYSAGAGIRMYLDLAFYLNEYRCMIDWDHFRKEVETLKITGFVNTVFCALESWFEIKSPILLQEVDSTFLDKFLDFTLNGGVFGHNANTSKLAQVRKNSDIHSVKRGNTLLKRAFPSAKSIKTRYTYLNGRPWLLPVAWVHRFFKKKNSATSYLNETKEIMKANKKEIVNLIEFYHRIGL